MEGLDDKYAKGLPENAKGLPENAKGLPEYAKGLPEYAKGVIENSNNCVMVNRVSLSEISLPDDTPFEFVGALDFNGGFHRYTRLRKGGR